MFIVKMVCSCNEVADSLAKKKVIPLLSILVVFLYEYPNSCILIELCLNKRLFAGKKNCKGVNLSVITIQSQLGIFNNYIVKKKLKRERKRKTNSSTIDF